jgi:hypothetical protein
MSPLHNRRTLVTSKSLDSLLSLGQLETGSDDETTQTSMNRQSSALPFGGHAPSVVIAATAGPDPAWNPEAFARPHRPGLRRPPCCEWPLRDDIPPRCGTTARGGARLGVVPMLYKDSEGKHLDTGTNGQHLCKIHANPLIQKINHLISTCYVESRQGIG